MEETIEGLVTRLRLTEEEQEEIKIPNSQVQFNVEKGQLSSIGKLLTTRPFSAEAMKNTLIMVWKPACGVSMKVLQENLFLFQFNHTIDKRRVLQNAPWYFDKNLMVLAEFNGITPIPMIYLNHAAFWIRVYGLLLAAMNRMMGELIGNKVGKFLDMNYDGDGLAWGQSMRLRIEIDISKPLRCSLMIGVGNGTKTWVQFKYEKLPNFCYYCGCLGHKELNCDDKLAANVKFLVSNMPYGPWMHFLARDGDSRATGDPKSAHDKGTDDNLFSDKDRLRHANFEPEQEKLVGTKEAGASNSMSVVSEMVGEHGQEVEFDKPKHLPN